MDGYLKIRGIEQKSSHGTSVLVGGLFYFQIIIFCDILEDIMEKTILIGGKAGQGTAVTSHLIAKIFCHLGYYVFNYRDYPSLITGGHNFNVISISDKPISSHKDKFDIILALDQKTIDLHKKNLNKGGIIFDGKGLKPIFGNNVLIGKLFKYFGVDKSPIFKAFEEEFKEKAEMAKTAIEEGYNSIEIKEKLVKNGKEKYLLSGNEGLSLGAIAAGMDIYIAYPMTPATSILSFLAKRQLEQNILVLQLENEIAVVDAAIGASFVGAKTMVGTSGGGFALMTESLSLAGMVELPLVIFLGQRTAPSTGVATYTGQGDLKFALNPGQGEFPRVVVAPGDAKEAIIRTQESFYLSSKYLAPIIILGDKHLSESSYSFDNIAKSSISNSRFILDKIPLNYKSYQITKTGVSPRLVPGQGPVVRANSYEHTDFGNTTENAEWIIKMNDKRQRKQESIAKETKKLNPVSIYGKGRNLIIGWGSTKGAIIDALPKLKNFRFLQISYLMPFPKEEVLKEIKKSLPAGRQAKKIILVENNSTGLLGDVIAEQTGFIIKNKILRYDARPFTAEYLINEIHGK
ncbi:MAG: 2-oxoacid:acceptor oxidoreductase family protein [Patescibacteria group bacterium]